MTGVREIRGRRTGPGRVGVTGTGTQGSFIVQRTKEHGSSRGQE